MWFPPERSGARYLLTLICLFEPITSLCASSAGDLLHGYHPELAVVRVCFENSCSVFCTINIARIVDLGKKKSLSVVKVEKSPRREHCDLANHRFSVGLLLLFAGFP